jgi:RNA polymerase sigma-70 factor (ECF subfamily)
MSTGTELDEHGIRAAYAAHAGEMFGFAARSLADRSLAEEAVQETFVRAWRFADRFDPELGTQRTWLFSILRHVVIDLVRARSARPQAVAGDVIDLVGDRESLDATDRIDRALLCWQVEEALRRLSEDHRRVLIETYFGGKTYPEVAADLQIPEGTVKSRVYYALRALRLALEEMGWDDAGV